MNCANNTCYLSLVLCLMLLIIPAFSAQSAGPIDNFVVKNNQVMPELKTLFMSQQHRQRIDQQRIDYLKPPKEVEPPKKEKVFAKKIKKKKNKKIYIPPEVTISAVVVKPDGSTLIRVNDKFNQSPSRYIQLNSDQANSQGVPVTVRDKTRWVSVGQTLLTNKNQVVQSYKLGVKSTQKVLPKTEQKSVIKRLDEVKIINADPLKRMLPSNLNE